MARAEDLKTERSEQERHNKHIVRNNIRFVIS